MGEPPNREPGLTVFHGAECALVGAEAICKFMAPTKNYRVMWRIHRQELIAEHVVYLVRVGPRVIYHAFPHDLRAWCRFKASVRETV